MEAINEKASIVQGSANEQEIELNEEQRLICQKIVEMATDDPMSPDSADVATLSGFAGTGKTTTVGEAVDTAVRLLMDQQITIDGTTEDVGKPLIVVCAKTHQAVDILRQKINAPCDFKTIDSVLGNMMEETHEGTLQAYKAGQTRLYDYKLAIIDECSMIGRELFADIMESRQFCRILFVGDSYQLPPVEDGQLSPTFNPAKVNHQWGLTTIMRQALENPIIRLATMFREGIDQSKYISFQDVLGQLKPGDEKKITIGRGDVQGASELLIDATDAGLAFHVVAYTNKVVLAVNAYCHAHYYGTDHDEPFCVGEKLIAHEQFDAQETLVNGKVRKTKVMTADRLTCLAIEQCRHPARGDIEAYKLTFEHERTNGIMECYLACDPSKIEAEVKEIFDRARLVTPIIERESAKGNDIRSLLFKRKAISAEAWRLKRLFAPIRQRYALTVHKSQGSTFDGVILHWHSFQHPKLSVKDRNRLAYVALTRASNYATFIR